MVMETLCTTNKPTTISSQPNLRNTAYPTADTDHDPPRRPDDAPHRMAPHMHPHRRSNPANTNPNRHNPFTHQHRPLARTRAPHLDTAPAHLMHSTQPSPPPTTPSIMDTKDRPRPPRPPPSSLAHLYHIAAQHHQQMPDNSRHRNNSSRVMYQQQREQPLSKTGTRKRRPYLWPQ